jgi:hypothetical protein
VLVSCSAYRVDVQPCICKPLIHKFLFVGVRQEDKEMAMELCGMSLLEVDDFLDEKRTHMTEGIIVGQVKFSGRTHLASSMLS